MSIKTKKILLISPFLILMFAILMILGQLGFMQDFFKTDVISADNSGPEIKAKNERENKLIEFEKEITKLDEEYISKKQNLNDEAEINKLTERYLEVYKDIVKKYDEGEKSAIETNSEQTKSFIVSSELNSTNHTVISGKKNVLLATFTLYAKDNGHTIKKLSLDNMGNGKDSIKKLTLKYPSYWGAIKWASIEPDNWQTQYTFDNLTLFVSKGVKEKLEIYADLNPITDKPFGPKSGDTIQLKWPYVDNEKLFESENYTNKEISHNSNNAAMAGALYILKTIPHIEYIGYNPKKLAYMDEYEILKFRINTDENSEINIKKIIFDVIAFGLDTTIEGLAKPEAWKIFNENNLDEPLNKSTWLNNELTFEFPENQKITANGSTYIIKGGNIKADNNKQTKGLISIKIKEDNKIDENSNSEEIKGNFIWSENEEETRWHNGYLVNIPKEYFYIRK